jgi:dienelactone hydrolase
MVRVAAFVIGLNVVLAGCIAHAPMPDNYTGPRDLPAAVAERYSYPSQSIDNHEESVKRRFGVTVREVSFPSPVDEEGDSPIRIEYYDVESDQPTPVVVVLPILNGQLLISRYFARYFANRGWSALVVDRDRNPLENDLSQPEPVLRQNIIEYRLVLDWIAQNPKLDSDSIGVFGVSFGGMDAVMLAALDDRVGAVVAAMAGGDLSYMLMNTSYGRINRSVSSILSASGMTREDLAESIDDAIATEPLALAPYVDAQDVLLILTRGDLIVPFEAQQELRDRLGAPEAFYLPTGHRTSLFYFPMMRNVAYEFFERRFASASSERLAIAVREAAR